MAKAGKLIETYFSHDIGARHTKKHVLLIEEMGFEGYGLYWAIVEFMHKDRLFEGEERLVAGKENEEKIKKILNNFGFFHISNEGEYISERILENLRIGKERSEQRSKSAEIKWLMADFKKYYVEIFGTAPCLENDDIKALKEYSEKIPDFRDKLADILYTLTFVKFDDKANGYKPLTNWLLSKHNLSSVYEGSYTNGQLKSWRAEKERRKKLEKERLEREVIGKDDFNIDEFNGKAEAIEFLKTHISDVKFIIPQYKQLMKKFDITVKEIKDD